MTALMLDTEGGLEMDLYRTRPDLWALSMALKHAQTYKPKIWSLISDSDKVILLAYSTKMRAVKAGRQGKPR